ncbi:MAG: ceramidase domain-containing protein [Pseudomonadota bacterium]
MDWTQQFDGYCERVDPTYWSEPVNAVTNAAFIIAALVMWGRTGGNVAARALCAVLFAIGVGSYLFHTHATGWALLADVAPIGIFILAYLFLVHRDMIGLRLWLSLGATALFLPYAAGVTTLLRGVPFFEVSNFYWTVPILLFVYGPALWSRYPATARGMVIGGAILTVSISFRSVDEMVCDAFPLGTHFMWHILNGVMLGWMIEVYARHVRLHGRGQGARTP